MDDLSNSLFEQSNKENTDILDFEKILEGKDSPSRDDGKQDWFYHSSIFDSECGANPLVASSASLFALVTRLKTSKYCTFDSKTSFDNVIHEIEVFSHKARNLGYSSNVIFVARYILCALLDETIMDMADGGAKYYCSNDNLLGFFYGENSGSEKFFVLLDNAYKDPVVNLDLLELMYFCLSLGFIGKYHDRKDGLVFISKIRNLLYDCINRHRKELKNGLCVDQDVIDGNSKAVIVTKEQKMLANVILTVGICVAALIGIILIYISLKDKVDILVDSLVV